MSLLLGVGHLFTRTGTLWSSASRAAFSLGAPMTTSNLLDSSRRTSKGSETPCLLKLAAFCVVPRFVAEAAKRRHRNWCWPLQTAHNVS